MHPLAKLLETNVFAAGSSKGWRTMWRHRHGHASAVVVTVDLACPPLDFLIFSPRLCLFTLAASRSTEFVADPVDSIVVFMLEI